MFALFVYICVFLCDRYLCMKYVFLKREIMFEQVKEKMQVQEVSGKWEGFGRTKRAIHRYTSAQINNQGKCCSMCIVIKMCMQ